MLRHTVLRKASVWTFCTCTCPSVLFLTIDLFTTPTRVLPHDRDAFAFRVIPASESASEKIMSERIMQATGHNVTSMSKRSPDPFLTSPSPLKHPRMESLSTRTQTLSRAQIISDEQLEHYHWLLCAALKNKSDPSQILQKVYGNCYGVWTTIDRSPVEKDQFLERVKNSDTQKQFFETLKKATNTPPNRKNLEDLFFHGMCFCYRTNQITNITQRLFSLLHHLHPRLSVGLQ